jgi:hypothetical protein
VVERISPGVSMSIERSPSALRSAAMTVCARAPGARRIATSLVRSSPVSAR